MWKKQVFMNRFNKEKEKTRKKTLNYIFLITTCHFSPLFNAQFEQVWIFFLFLFSHHIVISLFLFFFSFFKLKTFYSITTDEYFIMGIKKIFE